MKKLFLWVCVFCININTCIQALNGDWRKKAIEHKTYKALLDLVKAGEIEGVKKIIHSPNREEGLEGFDYLSVRDDQGRTPFMIALVFGKIDMAELLIKTRGPVHGTDNQGHREDYYVDIHVSSEKKETINFWINRHKTQPGSHAWAGDGYVPCCGCGGYKDINCQCGPFTDSF